MSQTLENFPALAPMIAPVVERHTGRLEQRIAISDLFLDRHLDKDTVVMQAKRDVLIRMRHDIMQQFIIGGRPLRVEIGEVKEVAEEDQQMLCTQGEKRHPHREFVVHAFVTPERVPETEVGEYVHDGTMFLYTQTFPASVQKYLAGGKEEVIRVRLPYVNAELLFIRQSPELWKRLR